MKTLRIIIISAVYCFIVNTASGQFSVVIKTDNKTIDVSGDFNSGLIEKKIDQFWINKTYIMIDDEKSVIGQSITKAIEKYWKITKYEFINTADAGAIISDPNNSFLFIGEYKVDGIQKTDDLCFLIGNGRKGIKSINKSEIVFQERIGSYRILNNEENQLLADAMPFYIQNMIENINMFPKGIDLSVKAQMKHREIVVGENDIIIMQKYPDISISSKTILIRDGIEDTAQVRNLSVNLDKDINDFKIVSMKEISKAFEDGDTAVAIIFLNGTSLFTKDATGTGMGAFYYNPRVWSSDGKMIAIEDNRNLKKKKDNGQKK
jgi:hypothetical protein